MPARNGAGPQSFGPRTGWGFGPCGLGLGRRFGAGRGLGHYFGGRLWPQDKEGQKGALTEYQKALEEELEDVKKEVAEL